MGFWGSLYIYTDGIVIVRECLLTVIIMWYRWVRGRVSFLKDLCWDVCIWIFRKSSIVLVMRVGVGEVWFIRRCLVFCGLWWVAVEDVGR